MKSTTKKIKYGKVEIPDEAFEPKNCRFRVNMFLSMDVLNELRKRAKEKDLPYQVYIAQVLREHVFGNEQKEMIRSIVREEMRKKTG